MGNRQMLRVVVIATSAWLVGCGGAAGVLPPPPTAGPLPTVERTYTDASGDAQADTGTAYDVTQVVTRRLDTAPFGAYDTMEVEIVLAQSVRLPDPGTRAGGGARLGFRLYLDTDQDGATGPITDPGCTFAGNEFLVNGFDRRLDSGAYEVQGEPWNGTSGQMVGEASVTRDEVHHTIIRIRVPLSTLGNDDGQMRVALRVGNGDDRTTDCAPEAGQAFTTGR